MNQVLGIGFGLDLGRHNPNSARGHPWASKFGRPWANELKKREEVMAINWWFW